MKVSDGLLRLRMEYDITDLEKDMRPAFRKNGNVKVCDTITRDIVVPSTETLCQLHFIIQKSFNWLWYHMHDFCFTDEDFEKIAKDEEGYRAQMGTLFSARMDEDEQEERDREISRIGQQGRGYKKLYNGKFPLEDPLYESCDVCQKAASSGKEFYDVVEGQLLERLSIGDIFARVNKLVYHYDYGDYNTVLITAKTNYDDLLAADLISIQEIEQQEGIAKEKQGPALLFADGYDCVEDVGGAWGLCEFFKGFRNGDEDLKAWAQELFWSPRKKNLKTFF